MTEFHFFGPTARLHHVGLAVSSIELAKMNDLEVFEDPIQKVRVGFVNVSGTNLELIEPVSEQSPVHNSIKKGHKLVHLCFELDDLQAGIDLATSYQFKVLQEPTPAVAFQNRRIAWVYHPVWGLYELLERDKADETPSV
ncbi:VOC family protein [Brevibacillus humidisoli]|uniref:VOC family protein n=1 Tax=Brevibacillus humidisoli TaxID=2895522 RepID=UPI001E451DCC|nr:VOC family protein [Brevibacillus humidisoli]UFJ40039.1 VOC family protein [Brevibacillus humidisoli]